MQEKFELTEKQAEYIENAHHRWNVAVGAVRSGKSHCQVTYCIPKRILERKGKRGLKIILGATRENIERNILEPMREVYGDSIATSINSKNYCKIMGEKVYCIGADKVSQVAKIRGSEIAYCAIDEATDINKEVFEMLKSRLSLPYSTCDITTNPASPNHWFKEFLDSQDKGVDVYSQHYTIYDNPFLPKEYVEALEAEYAGSVWYDRYILGEWTLAEGLVYPEYAQALKDIPMDDKVTDHCISLDYGTSNPFAAIYWVKHGEVWVAEKSIYYSGRDTGVQKTDEEYLSMMEELISDIKSEISHEGEDIWGNVRLQVDPVTVIIDPSAASFIALLRRSEWFTPVPANNDVVNGIRDTNTAMARGIIKISPTLKDWIREAQSYRWDTSSSEDKPIKEFDHLMDATRYLVNTKRLVKSIGSYNSILEGRHDHISGF